MCQYFVFPPLNHVLLTHFLMGKRHIFNCVKDTLIECVFYPFICVFTPFTCVITPFKYVSCKCDKDTFKNVSLSHFGTIMAQIC